MDPSPDTRTPLSHNLLAAAFDDLEDAFVVLDAEQRLAFANEQLLDLVERTREDVLGRDVLELFAAATSSARFAELLRAAIRSGAPASFETPFPPRESWLDVRVGPFDGGTSIQLADVTKRHQLMAQRGENMRLLEVISSITDGALRAPEDDDVIGSSLSRLLKALEADLVVLRSDGKSRVAVGDAEAEAAVDRLGRPSAISVLDHFVRADVKVAGESIGTLQVGWAARREDAEQDERLLALAADRIAMVLANTRLQEQRTETARLAQALIGISDTIHSSLEIDSVLDRVAEEAALAMGVEGVAILMPDSGKSLHAGYEFGLGEEATASVFADGELPRHTSVRETGVPVVIDDLLASENVNFEAAEKFRVRSQLLVQIPGRGQAAGVLGFYHLGEPGRFSDAQLMFAKNLANSIGLALENGRLYSAARGVAENLQAALLKLPRFVLGMPVAHAYRSASAMEGQVGGDFYDAFAIDGTHLAVLVGDVSGKGLDAAVLTSLACNAMRAYAADGDSPALVMAKTNRLMLSHTSMSTFATAVFAVVDSETGELTYSNAGHPAALIRRGAGGVDVLASNSPIVGAFDSFTYSQSTARLHPGDVLVLYTDGVLDARRELEFFGEERLEAIVAFQHADADLVIDGVLAAVDAFADRSAPDDIALLALQFYPPA